MARATLKDVAQLAGVSTATVSYALSGKRTISDETKQRIHDAIAELRTASFTWASHMEQAIPDTCTVV